MLTDHGELWYRPWRTLAAVIEPGRIASLTLVVDDPALPFRFARTLSLSAGPCPLVASYELVNRANRPLPYLWAAHPLLSVHPGDTIRLPAGARISATGSVGLDMDPIQNRSPGQPCNFEPARHSILVAFPNAPPALPRSCLPRMCCPVASKLSTGRLANPSDFPARVQLSLTLECGSTMAPGPVPTLNHISTSASSQLLPLTTT